jgi:hypothetical protein
LRSPASRMLTLTLGLRVRLPSLGDGEERLLCVPRYQLLDLWVAEIARLDVVAKLLGRKVMPVGGLPALKPKGVLEYSFWPSAGAPRATPIMRSVQQIAFCALNGFLVSRSRPASRTHPFCKRICAFLREQCGDSATRRAPLD